MKKNIRAFVYPMAIALITTGLIGCKHDKKDPSTSVATSDSVSTSDNSSTSSASSVSDVIELTVLKDNVKIKNTQINTYDYTSLFKLVINGKTVAVKAEMIDHSAVINKEGTYEVICTYQDKEVTSHVIVEDDAQTIINASVETITLKLSEIEGYDFTSCFSITYKNRPVTVTSSMITNNIKAEDGTYSVTCTYKNVSKSIVVIVEENYKIEIFEAYHDLEIPLSQMSALDYKDLFYLFVDGVALEITDDMIDHSSVTNVEVNKTYSVSLSYQIEDSSKTKTVSFKVVNDDEIVINSHNAIIYSNSLALDVTSLFTINDGGKEVEVTKDMINGAIIYDQVGTYTLTLNYKGQEKTCQVEVKKGVNIQYRSASRMVIKLGVDQNTYNFAGDFLVSVDGTRFNLNNSFIDTSKVDFTKEGEYTATITIPYGENQVVDGQSELTNVTKTITYVVLRNNAVVTPKLEVVKVDIDAKYDLFSNISCMYNNREKPLTSSKDWADDPTVTYAELIGETPNFSMPGEYLIEIRTYPYGLDKDYIDVSYVLEVSSGIEITENDNTVLFVGDSMYPREFFSLTEKGEKVVITDDMIDGKVNFFKAGNYPLTLNYKNESLTINVSIIDRDIVGTYVSPYQTLVKPTTNDSDSTDQGYGDTVEDEEDIVVARPLKDMIISKDGIKSLDGMTVTDWKALDANNFTFNIFSFEYMMHYEDGIVICLPLNDTHMSFSDSNRPFVYVNSDIYTIEKKLTIGSSSEHVFTLSNTGYSIDLLYLVNKKTNQGFWYGLKTSLIEKSGADCYYSHQYGEFNPDSNFDLVVGNNYNIEFLGEKYFFSLTSNETGKIVNTSELERKYSNLTFNGTIEGKNAVLSFNENQTISLNVEDKELFSVIFNGYASLPNGGINYNDDIIKIYDGQEGYSYEFNLDLANSTFTVTEYNHLFGLYQTLDSKYSSTKFFFDGYGKGVAYGLGNATYQTFNFTYKEENGLIDIKFKNVSEKFIYKDGITFRLDSFRNVITVDSIANKEMVSLKYVNEKIVEGLYVSFTKNTIPMMDSLDDTKNTLLSYINITTKDGLVTDSEKENYLDLSYIDFDQAGFYSVVIQSEINNKLITHYYGIQITEPLYKNHELVGVYQSASDDKYTFEFNEFGNAIITKKDNGVIKEYEGAVIFVDGGFIFEAKDANDNIITGNGKIEEKGLVSLLIQGSDIIGGYFYTSDYSIRVTGFGSRILREFTNQDQSIYFYCSNTTSSGQRVTIDILNDLTLDDIGVVFSAFDSEGNEVLYAKISSWSSSNTGLVLADSYRGDYTCDYSSLSLDGFGISQTKLGECKLDNVDYKYYAFNHEIFALLDDSGALVKYVIINLQNKTFSEITEDYSSANIIGTYGVVNYSAISTDYLLVIDKYGVGSFSVGSSSSDEDYESSEYEDSYSSTSSSSVYYGRIVSSEDVNGRTIYNFVGYTISDKPVRINITITKLRDYFVKCSAVNENIQVSSYMVTNYDTKVNYIGNESAKLITTINVNNQPLYLYFESKTSELKIARIEVLNSINFGTKGSIFNAYVGDTLVISEAMCTQSSYTPHNGYVYANELKGTYKPSTGSGQDLILDGFSYTMFDTEGKATYSRERVYRQFKDNIIELTVGSSKYIFELDIENKTYTRINSTYAGALLGTFTKVTPESSNPTITFDGFYRATYTSVSGTTYNCVVNHNLNTNEFTLTGTRVGDIYGNEIIVSGKLIGEGVIQFNQNDDGKLLSYYFVKDGYKHEVYSALSKTSGIIYQITKEATGDKYYYYAMSDIETLDGEVTIVNEEDSTTSSYDEVGSIFSLRKQDQIILVAKLEGKTLNSGYILANLDERKTYTDGTHTLFTNGFTESLTNISTATYDNETYYYYYNPSLNNTIVLYDQEMNIVKYVIYDNDGSINIQNPILTKDNFDLNTYRKMESPNYQNGMITFDPFGYFKIESYLCFATFNSDFTSFTFTGREGNNSISGTGKILERGLFFLQYSGNQSACDYYSTSENIISGGANGKNLIYQYETNGQLKYLFSKSYANNAPNDYIGFVNLVSETPDIPLGTIGSIFKVYTLDNQFLVRGKWSGDNGNVNVGYVKSDEYYGMYTNTDLGSFTLDGFGNANIGNDTGTYSIVVTNKKTKINLNMTSGKYVYFIDLSTHTYVAPTYDILKDQQFSCSMIRTFSTEKVSGKFVFDGAGEVTLYLYCKDDTYYSFWASQAANGVKGTYTLEGTTLHLKFNGDSYHAYYEYDLLLDDATNPTKLTVVDSYFEDFFTGYAAPGKEFTKN